MAPRSSSVLLLVLVRRILSGFFGVFECTCVSVCHFRVDQRVRTILAVNPTKAKKWNFSLHYRKEELLAMESNCSQDCKPTLLTVSQLKWESMKRVPLPESVLRMQPV